MITNQQDKFGEANHQFLMFSGSAPSLIEEVHLTPSKVNAFEGLHLFPNERIQKICFSSQFTAVWTEKRRLFMFLSRKPREISSEMLESDQRQVIVDVQTSNGHVFILTDVGNLYCGFVKKNALIFEEMASFHNECILVRSGKTTAYFVTKSNEIYTSNVYAAATTVKSFTLHRVDTLDLIKCNDFVEDIVCGSHHAFFITKKKHILGYG